MSETLMHLLRSLYNLKFLVQEPTCYKNPERLRLDKTVNIIS